MSASTPIRKIFLITFCMVHFSACHVLQKEVPVHEAHGDAEEEEIWDPLEDWNRATLLFNQMIDDIFIMPILLFYDGFIPPFLQERIHCVLANLSAITSIVNSLLQCDPEKFSMHAGGFLLNTTVGLGGLFNVAQCVGFTIPSEDFGKTLKVCGNVSPGFYIVIPILGPTNLRDMTGKVVDFFLSPLGFVAQNIDDSFDFFSSMQYSIGKNICDYMSVRLQYKDILEPIQKNFSDPYIILRHSYYVVRQDIVEDSFDDFMEEEDSDIHTESTSKSISEKDDAKPAHEQNPPEKENPVQTP